MIYSVVLVQSCMLVANSRFSLRWYVTGSQWSFQRLGYTFEPHFIVVSKIVMPGILLNLRSPQAFGSVKKCFLGSTTAGSS